MKRLFVFLFSVALLTSCENEGVTGKVIYKINFTTNSIAIKSSKSGTDDFYTNFGDYITSLTPTKFIAQIWTIGYVDTVLI